MTLLILFILSLAFESTRAATINNDVIPNLDKMVHFLVFGLLAWLLATCLSRFRMQASLLSVLAASLTAVTLLGVGDEWIQSYTPGRMAGVDDVIADMLGGFVFLAGWLVVQLRMRKA